jgi:hypothetical protein
MKEPAWWDEAGKPGPVMRDCLVAAAAAPSIHNTQPWLFRPRGGVIDVLVDRRRRLAVADPDGREMHVSVGAAVFNLRVAVHAHGRPARVTLMPDPSEPDVVARMVVGAEEVAPGPAATAFAEAIGRRHTNRRPFLDRPVPPKVLGDLGAAAEHEGAVVLAADEALRGGVWSLTRTAENRLREDPAYRAELTRWTTPGGVGRRDGVPRQAFGPRDVFGAIPMRDFALGNGAATATVTFEANPTVLLLFTTGDTPRDWVGAGVALERVLLTATVRGLAATPLSQVLEVPRLRALLDGPFDGQCVQSVLRVGFPSMPLAATPRRPLADVLLG